MYAVVTETSNDPSQQANVANLDRELWSFWTGSQLVGDTG